MERTQAIQSFTESPLLEITNMSDIPLKSEKEDKKLIKMERDTCNDVRMDPSAKSVPSARSTIDLSLYNDPKLMQTVRIVIDDFRKIRNKSNRSGKARKRIGNPRTRDCHARRTAPKYNLRNTKSSLAAIVSRNFSSNAKVFSTVKVPDENYMETSSSPDAPQEPKTADLPNNEESKTIEVFQPVVNTEMFEVIETPPFFTELETETRGITSECKKQFDHHETDCRKHISSLCIGSYACRICDKTFEFESELYRHMEDHVDPIVCPWPECDKKFVLKSDQIKHSTVHAVKVKRPYVCTEPKCGKRFAFVSNLVLHGSIHKAKKAKRMFACNYPSCDEQFELKDLLEQHNRVHVDRTEALPSCSEPTKSNEVVIENIVEPSERPDVAKETKSTDQPYAEEEMVSSRNFRKFKKSKGNRIDSRVGIKNPRSDHHLVPGWTLPKSLSTHRTVIPTATSVKSIDKSDADLKPTHSTPLNIEWPQPPVAPTKSQSTDSPNDQGITTIDGSPPLSNPESSENVAKFSGEPKTVPLAISFECGRCKKIIPNELDYMEHTSMYCFQRPIVCSWPGCAAIFFTQNDLSKHAVIHVEKFFKKTFKCNEPDCGRSFGTKYHLILHNRIHTFDKPYICYYPMCEQKFKRKTELNIHNQMHSCNPNHEM